ncbi:MAG: hypothetical protein QF535_08260 [Anaerolineales bacterium]|nr:hypothetical protein [Anaerolineales bacterium]
MVQYSGTLSLTVPDYDPADNTMSISAASGLWNGNWYTFNGI